MKLNYFHSLTLFSLICFTLSFSSCSKIKCGEINCSTGPPSLVLQLFDKDSDKSIFLTGRFKAEDIEVTDDQNKKVYFKYDTLEDFDFLTLGFNSQKGVKKINIKLSSSVSIPLEVEVVERSSECCTNSFVEDVKSPNYPIEKVAGRAFLKIKL